MVSTCSFITASSSAHTTIPEDTRVQTKELAEDGSLTIPSTELKHSGLYQVVAVNLPGRVEREVTLSVESESVEADNDPAYDTVPMCDSIPVAVFGDHVEQRHARNNKTIQR